VNFVNSPKISFETHEKISKYETKFNDVLLTIVGNSIGDVGIVRFKIDKCNLTENCARIIAYSLLPEFIFVFLNSKFGQNQIHREKVGTAQPKLALVRVARFKIPILGDDFQRVIRNIVVESYADVEALEKCYNQAQALILSELGLTNWQPRHRLTFVKKYSDTQQAGRIDAEYFQPKYDEIEEAIKSYSGGYSTIGEEFKQNKSIFKIDNNKNYQYVEIGSVNVSNGEILSSGVIGKELPANAKRVLRKHDIIVSKVRTYRGAITIVDKDGYVGSGAFTVLAENGKVNKETLLAFLHSKPLLAWSLKPNTGTSYPVIVDDDILNLPVPLLPQSKQQEIQQKVTDAFKLRKQSKWLLNKMRIKLSSG